MGPNGASNSTSEPSQCMITSWGSFCSIESSGKTNLSDQHSLAAKVVGSPSNLVDNGSGFMQAFGDRLTSKDAA